MALDTVTPAPVPTAQPTRRASDASRGEAQDFNLPDTESRSESATTSDANAPQQTSEQTPEGGALDASTAQDALPLAEESAPAAPGGSLDSDTLRALTNPEDAITRSGSVPTAETAPGAQNPTPAEPAASADPDANPVPTTAQPSRQDGQAAQTASPDAARDAANVAQAQSAPKASPQTEVGNTQTAPDTRPIPQAQAASQTPAPSEDGIAPALTPEQTSVTARADKPVLDDKGAPVNKRSDATVQPDLEQAARQTAQNADTASARADTANAPTAPAPAAKQRPDTASRATDPGAPQSQTATTASTTTSAGASAATEAESAASQTSPAAPTQDGEAVSLAASRQSTPAQTPGEQARARQARSADAAPAQETAASSTAPQRPETATQSTPANTAAMARPGELPPALAVLQADPLLPLGLDAVADAPVEPGFDAALDGDLELSLNRQDLRADALRPGAAQSQTAARFAPHTTQHLAAQITRKFADGGRVFDIRLDPPELGRVEVRLELGPDNRVSAVLSAERADTLAELQRSARDLEKALAEAGLDLSEDGLSFSLSEDASNPFEDPTDAQGESGAGRQFVLETDLPVTDTPPEALYGFAVSQRAGLNLIA